MSSSSSSNVITYQGFPLKTWRREQSYRALLARLQNAPVIILGCHSRNDAANSRVFTGQETEEPGTDPAMEMPLSTKLRENFSVYFLHKQSGRPYPEKILLGRSPANDIVVRNQTVSRVQASFQCNADQWWVYDLGATNGTFVNGQKLETNTKAPLQSDDCIAFGPKIYGFYFEHHYFLELLDET